MDEYYVITDDSSLVRKEDNTKEVEETEHPEPRLYCIYIYIDILGDSAGFQTSIPHAVTLQRPDIRPSCSGQSLEGCSQRPARELGHHPHSNCGARGGGIPGLVLGMWYITKKYNVKST